MKKTNIQPTNGTSRRSFIKGAASLSAVPVLSTPVLAKSKKTLRIGFVSPQTGPLAAFGEADDFVVNQIRKTLTDGIHAGGKDWDVEILVRDSQSSTSRAAEVATDLILRDEVDLICASSTGDTVNPVSDVAELNEVPCVTTDAPWEASYFARGGAPDKGFDWTYHFFWGLQDLLGAFTAMWEREETNHKVGGFFANDVEGVALSHETLGFPGPIRAAGYDMTLPGLATPMADDFSSFISAFNTADVQILTGAVIPPDFSTFWAQSAQQGLRQKLKFVTVAKAMLFPAAVEALGDSGEGITSEVWWSPSHPYKSGLSGQSAAEFAAEYTKSTGRQWTQPLGFKHALLEVAIDALKRSSDPKDPDTIRQAIADTDYQSIVGHVNWQGGGPRNPVKNVCTTKLVGGQWKKGTDFPYELAIVDNTHAPEISLTGELKLLNET